MAPIARGFAIARLRFVHVRALARGKQVKLLPPTVRERLANEARAFAVQGSFAFLPVEETIKAPALPALRDAWHLFNGLKRERIQVITLSRWTSRLRISSNGRLVESELYGSPWRDVFLWRVYETLMAMRDRLRFCRRDDCRRPFLARKRQLFCCPEHALSAADRNRRYWQKHRAKINKARKETYLRNQAARTGHARIHIQGTPRSTDLVSQPG